MSAKILIWLLASILIICSITLVVGQDDTGEKKLPQEQHNFGFMSLDLYYNETKLKNKLRLSKSHVKYVIKSDLIPGKLMTIKHSRLEELINCDNLTIIRQDRTELIKCEPLEKHILDDRYSSSDNDRKPGNYVRRSSFRVKRKYFFLSTNFREDLTLYPLRQDVIEKSIASSIAANNVGRLNFMEPNFNLGYYFQLGLYTDLVCSGNVFIAVNRSELFARLSDDPYPEFADELDYLLDMGIKNGYMFDLQDVSCHKIDLPEISLDIDFMIAHKPQFPYFTLRHNIVTKPLWQLLKYQASIDQVRDLDSPNMEAYNTSVSINSTSGALPVLHFNLTQIYTNEDFKRGGETMNLISPWFAAIVNAAWDDATYIKSLSIMILEETIKDEEVFKALKTIINLAYLDKSDENLILTLKLDKDVIQSWVKVLSKSLTSHQEDAADKSASRLRTIDDEARDEL